MTEFTNVRVQDLTKIYGNQRAVDNISFSVNKGDILGFLGPNGAGKSTTMKILTCFIPHSSGEAEVCGYNVSENPLEIRKKIGYLPEHNPLYKEMYVQEYLSFIARIHKLPNIKERVSDMIEQTGLTREYKKKIGALSKGYRQRIGLAQALIHDPEVLILDEPTSGLDPNQLVEIRELIRKVGEEKTVIFSTHIMQEVQALCNRVLIINKGKLVADDHIDDLKNRVSGGRIVRVEFGSSIDEKSLANIAGVSSIKKIAASSYEIISDENTDVRRDIFQYAVSQNQVILEMSMKQYNVENIFQELTKQ